MLLLFDQFSGSAFLFFDLQLLFVLIFCLDFLRTKLRIQHLLDLLHLANFYPF